MVWSVSVFAIQLFICIHHLGLVNGISEILQEGLYSRATFRPTSDGHFTLHWYWLVNCLTTKNKTKQDKKSNSNANSQIQSLMQLKHAYNSFLYSWKLKLTVSQPFTILHIMINHITFFCPNHLFFFLFSCFYSVMQATKRQTWLNLPCPFSILTWFINGFLIIFLIWNWNWPSASDILPNRPLTSQNFTVQVETKIDLKILISFLFQIWN